MITRNKRAQGVCVCGLSKHWIHWEAQILFCLSWRLSATSELKFIIRAALKRWLCSERIRALSRGWREWRQIRLDYCSGKNSRSNQLIPNNLRHLFIYSGINPQAKMSKYSPPPPIPMRSSAPQSQVPLLLPMCCLQCIRSPMHPEKHFSVWFRECWEAKPVPGPGYISLGKSLRYLHQPRETILICSCSHFLGVKSPHSSACLTIHSIWVYLIFLVYLRLF